MQKIEVSRQIWLNNPGLSQKEIKSLEKMKGKSLEQSFGLPLNFGTAGMRGIMGIGPAKINRFTIGGAAYAYGKFLIEKRPNWAKKGVVVGHDNRRDSSEYALRTAKILHKLGIKVLLFKNNELQPTPFISYAVRKLKLGGAVMITASHNPKEHNGFKVYNDSGAQLLPDDTNLIGKIMSETNILKIEMDENPKIYYVNDKLADDYVKEILKLQLRPNDSKILKVAFTPQHGTSHLLIPRIFQNMNINYCEVKAQMKIDPNFSKTKSPNPENPSSFNRAIFVARRTKSDLVVCVDPDGDRIGVAVRHKKRYKFLNGNEMAAIYLNYMISEYKKQGKNLNGYYIVKSLVSGTLVDKIAKRHNINVYETHVGFKNIAEFIDKNNPEKFLFAFEESFGFLLNANISRDKDSVQSALGIVEAANYYKTQNSNLYIELKKLNQTFSYHRTHTYTLELSSNVLERAIMRLSKVKQLANVQIVNVENYQRGLHGLESQNLIKLYFKDQRGWIAIRPSGTEAKVKIYLNLVSSSIYNNVVFERKIKENILDYIEDSDTGKITRKTVFKYSFFVGILIAIFIILLYSLYDVSGSPLDFFKQVVKTMQNGDKIWLFLLIFFANGFTPFFTAIYTVRAMRLLGIRVKFRHASIAATLAICVSAITPFATGGALASYWYMRKKGYARSEVMATYFMSSLLYQSSLVLRTFIFLPMGIYFFRDVYYGNSVESNLVIVLTLVGILFDVFATFMIALLTFSKKMHFWIVQSGIHFLERFNLTKDPESIRGKYLYEMEGLRSGMTKLKQNKFALCEFMFYELVPMFISTMFFSGQIILTANGHSSSSGIDYLKFITGQNLVRLTNNMIPTPGGSGTTEWMTSVLFQQIFGNYLNSIEFTALNRLWTYIIPILMSATLLVVIYANERVNSKINSKVKNYGLTNKGVLAIKNKFRIWAIIGLTSIFTIVIGALLFIVFV